MHAWFDQFIERDHKIQGGAPIVRGTRTPVRSIVLYLRVYENDVSQVRRALAYLSSEEIDAALAYYNANRDIVEADILAEEQALQQFLAASE